MRATVEALITTILDTLRADSAECVYEIDNKNEFNGDCYLTRGRKLTVRFRDGQTLLLDHTLAKPEAKVKAMPPPEDLPKQPNIPYLD